MINELYSVLLGARQARLDIEPVHGDIQEPGKGNSLRVLLDGKGEVTSVNLIPKEDFSDIFTIGNGNKNQFPCIKLIYPLRPTANENYECWREQNKNPTESKTLKAIESIRDKSEVRFPWVEEKKNDQKNEEKKCWPNYRKKIEERAQQLKSLLSSMAKPAYSLYLRYLSAPEKGLGILRDLDEVLWQTCLQNTDKDFLKVAAAVMFGKNLDRNGRFKDGERITLVLDFKPDPDSALFATSRKYVTKISKALNKNKKTKQKTRSGKCSILGDEVELVDDKFPRIKLPVIGNMNLYSRYDGSGNLSVLRYGSAKSDAYSMSAKTAEDLGAVIKKLTESKLQLKTWDSLPSESKGADLLLVFCRDMSDVALTVFLTGDPPKDFVEKLQKQNSDSEKRYIRYCEGVFEAIKQRTDKDKVREPVDIMILRKINDGNQKVIYSTSQPLGLLMDSAKEWDSGCHNVPPVKLSARIGKEDKLLSPWTAPPKAIVQHLGQAFTHGGYDSIKVHSISFADVMRLYLVSSHPSVELTSYVLSKLVSQFGLLLERVAKFRLQIPLGNNALVRSDPEINKKALIAVSMIGLVLYKRQRYKERYMEDFAFKLGQLCAAFDELHLAYCQGMRNGQIPNTLIGNQSYGIALQFPLKALDLLAMRLKPYKAWADKQKNPKESDEQSQKIINNGLYAYRWIKKEGGVLRKLLVKGNYSVDDQYKAELMLGYLSGRPYTPKNKSNTEPEKEGNRL